MGLDMYLNKKTYIKRWEHTPKESVYHVTIDREKGHRIKTERVTFIEEELMYWRKANHIHAFFIDRCGDEGGYHNCREMHVDTETITDLINKLKKVVKAKDDSVSNELLPTAPGFFWGATEYDEYYYEECERTLNELSDLVDSGDADCDLYYEASW